MNTAAAANSITLGDAIRIAITHTGDSLEVVAAQVGVTSKTLSRWQCDHTEPKFSEVVKLAEVTGYDVSFFARAFGPNQGHPLVVIEGEAKAPKGAKPLALFVRAADAA
jgi:transcriptional regulator with XRE-family HTH domain